MTATSATVRTAPTAASQAVTTRSAEGHPRLWRAGLVAGLVAAVANVTVAAAAEAADISFEIPREGGESIPLLGFAQITLVAALIGTGIAALVRRRSCNPAVTFTRITVALTAMSMVPPAIVDADVSTKVVLVLTHLLAAVIVIPVLAGKLRD
jgi:hypothetical protein